MTNTKPVSKPRSRAFVAKFLLVSVILLICLQYLVNMVVYKRNHSTILTVISLAFENGSTSGEFLRQFVTPTTTEKPLEPCPLISPYLKGRVSVNLQIPAWAYVEEQNQILSAGGRHKPSNCLARHKVAIVIPYRDREVHLKIFLQNIHPFLRSQQLDYAIFVVELAPRVRFNRAALMNIGFIEASKMYDFDCFIFHDVDLLPEDDRNLYVCPSMPRHMSAAIDKLNYKLPYPQIFGGVSAISKDHFIKINGFSNFYFGWGGEDDDMYKRILYSNLTITRYSQEIARYKMLSHVKDKGNPQRYKNLKTTRARRPIDGINSLTYTRLKLEFRPLYTWIYVSLNETDIMKNKVVIARVKAATAQQIKLAKEKAAQLKMKKKAQKLAQKNASQDTKQAIESQVKKAQTAANLTQPPETKANLTQPTQAKTDLSQQVQTETNLSQQSTAEKVHTEQKTNETVVNKTVIPLQKPAKVDTAARQTAFAKAIKARRQAIAKAMQQQRAALEKVNRLRKAAQAKVRNNPKAKPSMASAFAKKPEVISWIPTNASVPVNLTIKERLGPKPLYKLS